MKVNLGLYQLDIFSIPSWVIFGHFYASFRKCLSGMPYILGKYIWIRIRKFMVPDSRGVSISPLWRPFCRSCKQIAYVLGNDWYRLYFFEINRKRVTGNSVMFMLLHWYCHRGLGCGKLIKFTLKIFNIFGDAYTRDGTISLCQRDASARIVRSHNYSTQVSDPFRSHPPWSPNDMIITVICQYIVCPI